ncbi:MAG: NADH-quinone oxidoreductase subunit NuoG [Armatimonadetes bacterium]|nr:NADH-quinone oxidoreductase subunit NuoG [Armatimonadota bacterium]MDW8153812.1 NADH-quinone oxidoreductase subunit NuoG [Armatimonadota bacterium]
MADPESVTLTIDGRTVTVPRGTTVLHAAERLGIEVPVFCYHERMPPLGACRMCLVRVERMPRLQTACTLEAQEGMVVWTEAPEVVEARRAILEFLLINHPLDCPICDKGGECPLQDNTFKYGPGASRFVEPKRHFPKAVPLSPVLTLDRERCILCWRCVRFGEVVAGDHALKGHERGYLTHIDAPPIAQENPSKFIGNTIAICPVGALTSGVYRFRARPWDNRAVAGVCTHCGLGCAVWVDVRGGEVVRIRAREHRALNDIWLCDLGFFGYDYLHHPDRLRTPYVRRGDRLEPCSWDEALERVAHRLREAAPEGIGALGGERLTLEEAYLLSRLVRTLGSNNLDFRVDTLYPLPTRDWAWGMEGVEGGEVTDPDGRQRGLAPRPIGGPVDQLDLVRTLVLVGCDLSEEYPVLWLRAKRALDRGANAVVLAPKRLEIERYCSHPILHRYGHEHRLLFALARLVRDRMPHLPNAEALDGVDVDAVARQAGVSVEALERAAEALRQGPVAFFVGRMSLLGPHAERVLRAANTLRALCGGTLSLLQGRGSAIGAAIAGMAPDVLPGLRPLDDPKTLARIESVWGVRPPPKPGLNAVEMLKAAAHGTLRVLYVAGADPARDFPDAVLWARARANLFLVVTDLFWTDTARAADVVLPALAFAERSGTVGNIEGRPQRLERARLGPEGAWADGTILQALAARLGLSLAYPDPEAVFAEMRRVIPGLEVDRPYPLPRRAPRIEPVDLEGPGDEGDGLVLVPVPRLFRQGEMAERCRGIPDLVGEPFAILHPEDAASVGVRDEDAVELEVDGIPAAVRCRLSRESLPGQVLVPMGFRGIPLSRWGVFHKLVRVRVRALEGVR